MGTYRTVTANDVARDMAISPQRVREMQCAGYFHMAKLVNPRKRNYKWRDNADFAKFRKQWGRREKRQLKGDSDGIKVPRTSKT